MSEFGSDTPGFERANRDFLDVLGELDNELDQSESDIVNDRTASLFKRLCSEIESTPTENEAAAFSFMAQIQNEIANGDLTETDKAVYNNIYNMLEEKYLKPRKDKL